MFEGNSLSAQYHLRDLERQFTPKLESFDPDHATAKFNAVATILALAVVVLSVGTAYLTIA